MSVVLNPSSIIGGNPVTGSVTLNGTAPAGGTQVALSSDQPGAVTVPGSVTVPAGATSVPFTVTTNVVSSATVVNVSATAGGVTQKAQLTVNPQNIAGLSSVTVSSQNTATGQLGIKAIDGIVDGYPGDYTKEWATLE